LAGEYRQKFNEKYEVLKKENNLGLIDENVRK